ncbi:MAG: lysozyme inhibitor LprI family protein [Cyanobacteria bacterium P01_B01_bin.77]
MKLLHQAAFLSIIVSLLGTAAQAEEMVPNASGDTEQPIPGVVRPRCADQSQTAMNRCAERWWRLTETLHEVSLDDASLDLSPQVSAQLFQTEIVWEAFRNSHCQLTALQVQGGSLYRFVLNNCLARTTNERIAAIQAWGPVPADLAQAEQSMAVAHGNLLREMVPDGEKPEFTQLRWQVYRTQHCRYEAMLQTIETADPELLENQCRARLAVERTVQLEQLVEYGW